MHRPTWIRLVLAAVGIAATVWVMQTAMTVLLPLSGAIILVAMLEPIPRTVEKRLGEKWRWLGSIAAAITPLLCLGSLGALSVFAAQQIPMSSEELGTAVDDALAKLQEFGLPVGDSSEMLTNVSPWVTSALEQLLSAVGGAVVISLLMLLAMGEAHDWGTKVEKHFGEGSAQRLKDAWFRYGRDLRRYAMVRVVTGGISGALTATWLAIVGAPEPLLWGTVTFLLNFIPNIGSMLSALPPTLILYGQGGFGAAASGAAGMFLIEQIVGNYLDPRLQGHSLSISSFMVLAVVLAMAWIWGPVGAILAVPMLLGVFTALELTEKGRRLADWVRAVDDEEDADDTEDVRVAEAIPAK